MFSFFGNTQFQVENTMLQTNIKRVQTYFQIIPELTFIEICSWARKLGLGQGFITMGTSTPLWAFVLKGALEVFISFWEAVNIFKGRWAFINFIFILKNYSVLVTKGNFWKLSKAVGSYETFLLCFLTFLFGWMWFKRIYTASY